MVFDVYFNLTKKSIFIGIHSIQLFDNLAVAYFSGHPVDIFIKLGHIKRSLNNYICKKT